MSNKNPSLLKILNKIIPFLLGIFIISGIIFNVTMRDNLETQINSQLEKDARIISQEINTYFAIGKEVVKQMNNNSFLMDNIYNPSENQETNNKLVNTLKDIHHSGDFISLVWIGLVEENKVISSLPDLKVDPDFIMIERPWFYEMIKNPGTITFSSPYIDAFTGNYTISIMSPIYDNGILSGVTGIDIHLHKINEFLDSYRIGENGHPYLLMNNGEFLYHRHPLTDNTVKYFADLPLEIIPGWYVGAMIPKSETSKQLFFFNIISTIIILSSCSLFIFLLYMIRKSKDFKHLTGLYEELQSFDEELQANYDEIQSYNRKIEELAFYDHLTGLPNRTCLYNKLKDKLNEKSEGALFLLDIDNFKGINDTMGHIAGDKILIKVSKKLSELENGNTIVGRLGGDEFLILSYGIKDPLYFEKLAIKIASIFEDKIEIEGKEIYLTCSIGISLFPEDGRNPEILMMKADMSMYKAKDNGKNHFLFFENKMSIDVENKILIQNELRYSLENKLFKIAYQPQVSASTGEILGFEGLLRISNSSLSPGKFIPVAEETGIIIEIGRIVTEKVIVQLAEWKGLGLNLKPIAINFSPKQLNDKGYIFFLEELLKKYDISGEYICIEITESIFLENEEETIIFLNEFRKLGIAIAIDDFGTGYSSLSHLSFLPVDKIKLDKSLFDNFEDKNIDVIHKIIGIAHDLNLEVIAEGIETIDQFHKLKQGNINIIQGFLFSKPLFIDELNLIYNKNFLN